MEPCNNGYTSVLSCSLRLLLWSHASSAFLQVNNDHFGPLLLWPFGLIFTRLLKGICLCEPLPLFHTYVISLYFRTRKVNPLKHFILSAVITLHNPWLSDCRAIQHHFTWLGHIYLIQLNFTLLLVLNKSHRLCTLNWWKKLILWIIFLSYSLLQCP